MIEMCDVSKTYGKGIDAPYALKHVSFHMESGEQVCLTGKSGSGKSTFLNLIGAMDMPSEGQILFDGKLLSGSEGKLARHRRENIGYIFQSFYLLPALTVRENITMPLHINRKKLDKEWMAQVVTELGIGDKLNAYPLQLSGGQQQRVAIARAIIHRPKLILADEPTGNLDSESAGHVMRLLRSSINQLGTSLLLVTHDEDISASFCRVLRLKDGEIISDDKRTVSDDG